MEQEELNGVGDRRAEQSTGRDNSHEISLKVPYKGARGKSLL